LVFLVEIAAMTPASSMLGYNNIWLVVDLPTFRLIRTASAHVGLSKCTGEATLRNTALTGE
jgi:hypothetical protein